MKKKNDEFAAKKRAIEHTLKGSNRTFRKIDVFEAVTSCPFCGKRYAQFSKHIWQPDCNCINGSINICVLGLEPETGGWKNGECVDNYPYEKEVSGKA